MKLNWNRRYTTYAIYAALVLAAVIFCIFAGIYFDKVIESCKFVLNVLAPILYGCIIAYLLMPILRLCEKRIFAGLKNGVVRRVLSVTLTFTFLLLFLTLLFYAIIPQITRSASDLQTSLITYSSSLQDWVNSMAAKDGFVGTIFTYITSVFDFSMLSQPITALIELLYELLKDLSPYIMNFFGSFVVQLKNIILGIIFAAYLMTSKELVLAQINKLLNVIFSKERLEKIKSTVKYTDRTFGKYLIGTLLDAIIVGCVTAVGMLIFGIPYVPLVSVIVACTNIIPVFGPFIGAIPSFLFIFIANPGKALTFVILILVIQQLDGNLIAPRVLGNATGLPAIGVITAITVMGGLFGILGMVIGVPVFALLGKFINDKTEQKIKARQEKAAESEAHDENNEEKEPAPTASSEKDN